MFGLAKVGWQNLWEIVFWQIHRSIWDTCAFEKLALLEEILVAFDIFLLLQVVLLKPPWKSRFASFSQSFKGELRIFRNM